MLIGTRTEEHISSSSHSLATRSPPATPMTVLIPSVIVNQYFNTRVVTSMGEPAYINSIIRSKERINGSRAHPHEISPLWEFRGRYALVQQWYQINIQRGADTGRLCIFQNAYTGGYAYADPTNLVAGAPIVENVVATLWRITYIDGKSTISPEGLPETMQTLYWSCQDLTSGIACTLQYGDNDARNMWTIKLYVLDPEVMCGEASEDRVNALALTSTISVALPCPVSISLPARSEHSAGFHGRIIRGLVDRRLQVWELNG
ncbi:hypothetical protein BC629DRAFT_1443733 [Irpex lacteus]|nr:hypothetical protein BC629DRAFT_1443733 [Irpex lacteus]